MNKQEAEELIAAIRRLVDTGGPPPRYNLEEISREVKAKQKGNGKPIDTTTAPTVNSIGEPRASFTDADLEQLYQAFKGRLIDECRVDPILLQLLTRSPELEVLVEPQVVSLDGSTLEGRVARLLAAGWFDSTRATSAVRAELSRTGVDPGGGGRLSETLAKLRNQGFLVNANGGWLKAAGVKVTERTLTSA